MRHVVERQARRDGINFGHLNSHHCWFQAVSTATVQVFDTMQLVDQLLEDEIMEGWTFYSMALTFYAGPG